VRAPHAVEARHRKSDRITSGLNSRSASTNDFSLSRAVIGAQPGALELDQRELGVVGHVFRQQI